MSEALSVMNPGARMSSREIADLTGKQHAHVCRDIRRMCEELEINPSSFGSVYPGGNGESRTEYLLPHDECMTLVAGYNVRLRHRIVCRWSELEQKTPAVQLPNFQNPADAARAWAKEYEGRAQAEQQLALARPAIQFAETVSAGSQEMTIRAAAKVLKTGEVRLFSFLREAGILMRDNTPYQRYIDNGWFALRMSTYQHPVNGKTAYGKTMITGKGLQAINRKLAEQSLAQRCQHMPRQHQMEVCA